METSETTSLSRDQGKLVTNVDLDLKLNNLRDRV